MMEYTPHYYGKYGVRMNPNYPSWHCCTMTRCEECGELYEADKEHICKEKNSYPWDMGAEGETE